jgi:hypothetical protein
MQPLDPLSARALLTGDGYEHSCRGFFPGS